MWLYKRLASSHLWYIAAKNYNDGWCVLHHGFFTSVKFSTSIHVLYNNHEVENFISILCTRKLRLRKVSYLPKLAKLVVKLEVKPNSSPSQSLYLFSPDLLWQKPTEEWVWGCQMRTSMCYKAPAFPNGHRYGAIVTQPPLVCAMGDDGFGEARYFGFFG